jgi:hypothetical protein
VQRHPTYAGELGTYAGKGNAGEIHFLSFPCGRGKGFRVQGLGFRVPCCQESTPGERGSQGRAGAVFSEWYAMEEPTGVRTCPGERKSDRAANGGESHAEGALSAASMCALERISPRGSERARSAPRRPACMYTQPPGGGSFFNRATRSPLQATRAAECAGGGVCMRQPVSVPVERGCATTARGCAEHSRLPAGTYPPCVKADKCQRERGR